MSGMRKRLYFVGVMAQVGTFSTIALLLWWMTKMDVLKLFCISAVVSSMISLGMKIMIDNTCCTCIDIEDGFCDRKGILVEDDDSCDKHREANKEVR